MKTLNWIGLFVFVLCAMILLAVVPPDREPQTKDFVQMLFVLMAFALFILSASAGFIRSVSFGDFVVPKVSNFAGLTSLVYVFALSSMTFASMANNFEEIEGIFVGIIFVAIFVACYAIMFGIFKITRLLH